MQGIRDYRTDNPVQLRTDLQRQNAAIESALAAVERERLPRWKVVVVTASTYQASHGELVLCGWNQNTVVTLPTSTPETAGLSVRVGQVGGVGGAFVAPPSGQTVNALTTTQQVGINNGWAEYVDDGMGRWWGHLQQ